jgi:hypothetical protein
MQFEYLKDCRHESKKDARHVRTLADDEPIVTAILQTLKSQIED